MAPCGAVQTQALGGMGSEAGRGCEWKTQPLPHDAGSWRRAGSGRQGVMKGGRAGADQGACDRVTVGSRKGMLGKWGSWECQGFQVSPSPHMAWSSYCPHPWLFSLLSSLCHLMSIQVRVTCLHPPGYRGERHVSTSPSPQHCKTSLPSPAQASWPTSPTTMM